MFEVGIVTQFEAAHRLHGNFGPATRRHGHTYRVEVSVQGEALGGDGTLCDIGMLQQVVKAAVDPLHYQDLDELTAFRGKNSTAEMVALHLWNEIAAALIETDLVSLTVRVWESPQVFATHSDNLGDLTMR